MAKLQIALDVISLPSAIALLKEVENSIDIIEAGTPFLLDEGLAAVRTLREMFPDKEILADAKICDAGEYEARQCIEAGADYVTVLAVSDLRTIRECAKTAKEAGALAVCDMICVSDIPGRVRELLEAGIRDIAVHTGIDQQRAGRTPLNDLRAIRACTDSSVRISAAGGIRLENADPYLDEGADVIICGGSIAGAPDPAAMARAIAAKVHKEPTLK